MSSLTGIGVYVPCSFLDKSIQKDQGAEGCHDEGGMHALQDYHGPQLIPYAAPRKLREMEVLLAV